MFRSQGRPSTVSEGVVKEPVSLFLFLFFFFFDTGFIAQG